MDVLDALTWKGGVADARTLNALSSRKRVRTALRKGEIVRVARGSYALPDAQESRRAAARLSGVASHLSAAQRFGWELKHRPAHPTVTVPRTRKVDRDRRAGVDVKWRDLDPDDVWNGATGPGQTVIDCAKDLPFDEALAVADSALRHQHVTPVRLLQLAELVPSTGRTQALRVAREASGLAANPFESVLRAIALDIPGLDLKPQVLVAEDGWSGWPDLVDVERRLVVEADSFEFHGKRKALKRDCERYNALVIRGWTVLRFAWEHVMYDPTYVVACLTALTRPQRHAAFPVPRRLSA